MWGCQESHLILEARVTADIRENHVIDAENEIAARVRLNQQMVS